MQNMVFSYLRPNLCLLDEKNPITNFCVLIKVAEYEICHLAKAG